MAALAARRLDRTLTTSLPAVDPRDDTAVGPTGVAALDGPLGGFPRGQLSEIAGSRSSGRTSTLLRMCAACTARGELVALVDALDRFDPESAVAAGVNLDRLLWVRGHVTASPGPAREANQRALEQAVKALTLVLQAGNFGLVVFDVGDAPVEALRRLPLTTWLRLQRMLDGRQTMCVSVGSEPMARSAAGLTITMKVRSAQAEGRLAKGDPRGTSAGGRRFHARLFAGLDVEARVIRARARIREDVAVSFATEAVNHG